MNEDLVTSSKYETDSNKATDHILGDDACPMRIRLMKLFPLNHSQPSTSRAGMNPTEKYSNISKYRYPNLDSTNSKIQILQHSQIELFKIVIRKIQIMVMFIIVGRKQNDLICKRQRRV